MWSIWGGKARERFSLEELKHLNDVLLRQNVISDSNKDVIVETLRSIAELMIWGDQHEPTFFEFFVDNLLATFTRTLGLNNRSSKQSVVALQLLQTLNIMIQNMRSTEAMNQFFSKPYINSIIAFAFDFSDEELLAYYISLMKTISMKLDASTIHYFITKKEDGALTFPLYVEAIRFFHHEESMVRIAVRTITLNIYNVKDSRVRDFVLSPSAIRYFEDLAVFVRQQSFTLTQLAASASRNFGSVVDVGRVEAAIAEVGDLLYYCNDVMGAGIPELSDIVSDHLLSIWVFPVLLASLQPEDENESPNSKSKRISPLCAMYLMSRLLHIVSYKPFLDIAVSAVAASLDQSEESLFSPVDKAQSQLEEFKRQRRSSSFSAQKEGEEEGGSNRGEVRGGGGDRQQENGSGEGEGKEEKGLEEGVSSFGGGGGGEGEEDGQGRLSSDSDVLVIDLDPTASAWEMTVSYMLCDNERWVMASLCVLTALLHNTTVDDMLLQELGMMPCGPRLKTRLVEGLWTQRRSEEQQSEREQQDGEKVAANSRAEGDGQEKQQQQQQQQQDERSSRGKAEGELREGDGERERQRQGEESSSRECEEGRGEAKGPVEGEQNVEGTESRGGVVEVQQEEAEGSSGVERHNEKQGDMEARTSEDQVYMNGVQDCAVLTNTNTGSIRAEEVFFSPKDADGGRHLEQTEEGVETARREGDGREMVDRELREWREAEKGEGEEATCSGSTASYFEVPDTRQRRKVIDALIVLLCKRPPACPEALWHAGWLLRHLIGAGGKEVKGGLTPPRLKLLNHAYNIARDNLIKEMLDCWSDLLPAAVSQEWKVCRKALESASLRNDSSLVLLPSVQPLSSEGDISSAAQGERMRSTVKVFVALHQIRCLLLGISLAESLPFADLSTNQMAEIASLQPDRGGRRVLPLSLAREGALVELTPGSALPCRVAFERGKEKRVMMLLANQGTEGWLVLSESVMDEESEGVVRVVAPLAGCQPSLDSKHKRWLHLRIRSPQHPAEDAGSLASRSPLGSRARMKRLADGRWTLAFPDEAQCKYAQLVALEEIHIMGNVVRSILEPLLGPVPPFMLKH